HQEGASHGKKVPGEAAGAATAPQHRTGARAAPDGALRRAAGASLRVRKGRRIVREGSDRPGAPLLRSQGRGDASTRVRVRRGARHVALDAAAVMRPHYSARPGTAGARKYRGVNPAKRKADPELPVVPVTERLVECPECHGGVKLVFPPGRYGTAPQVLAAHRYGGSGSRGWDNRCPKSLEAPGV